MRLGAERLVCGALVVACEVAPPGGEGISGGATTGEPTAPVPSSTTGPGAEGTTSSGTTASASEDVGAAFPDTPPIPDVPEGDCECGNDEWSYLWLANPPESTVSKVNARTFVEEGRYLTRADAGGSPSRTSVSIDGRAVAVANRFVGLAKIWARESLCSDENGNGVIDTSSGPDDVLDWGVDECVAWFTDFEGMSTQRPVAWTAGTLDESTCTYRDQKIWTTTGSGGASPGTCAGEGVWVHRVDGETGIIEDSLHIPEAEATCAPHAAYGGAVDADGNFFFHIKQQTLFDARVFRVDAATLEYEWAEYGPNPDGKYGITVDTSGRVWTAGRQGLVRYDFDTGEAVDAGVPHPYGSGVAQDHQGRIWVGVQTEFEFGPGFGLAWADVETAEFGELVPLPTASVIKGVSVDVDGGIWAVPLLGGAAFRIDPDTLELELWQGTSDVIYTYSDMTGGQLDNVTCVPAG